MQGLAQTSPAQRWRSDGRLREVEFAGATLEIRIEDELGKVPLNSINDEQAEAFYKAVTALPEVISAFLVSGESDFLLQVVVPDLRAYDRFLSGCLLKLPGVSDIRSNFAIHTVKTPGALPLGHLPL